jgi:hypothetical protein
MLVGSSATAGLFIALRNQDTGTAHAPTCPGVCVDRMLHGAYATNVSATKSVGPVTVVVQFHVAHTFDWASRTAEFRVDPIDMKPHWLPNVLHSSLCTGVPFALGEACNVTLDNACVRAAYAADDIVGLSLLWQPGADVISARETVDTGFFTQTFVWDEPRA